MITLYVARMWAMLFAGEVRARPKAHNKAPAIATLRYENSRSKGPTKSPEKFIITSRQLIIRAAPVVPTSRSRSKSPKSRPKEGSMERVANWKRGNFMNSLFKLIPR